ncbi:hypothetical protein PG990_015127 [Apiospora arundinis]
MLPRQSPPTPYKRTIIQDIEMRHYHVFRVWIWEIFFVFLAFGLIVAIAVLLHVKDGKPVPDWGDYISFNALLAILSTILRAALVVTASPDHIPKKMGVQFDAGSRGTLGALLLLPTIIRGDAIALMAIVVLLASFLVGPFVQQASRTEERLFVLPGTNASLPFAHYVPRQGGFVLDNAGSISGVPSQDLVAAILSAVTATDGIENQIRPICATGKCQFSGKNWKDTKNITHSTVGMCNKCTDLSSLTFISEEGTMHLKNAPKEYNITLTNSHDAIIKGTEDLAWLGDLFTPNIRAIFRWAYINSTFLARGNDNKVVAAVCSLYPCLRTYHASIENNRLSESEIRSDLMQLAIPRNSQFVNGTGDVHLGHVSSLLNARYHYAAVKSQCLGKDGTAVYLSQNLTSRPGGATDLDLWDYTDHGGPAPYHPAKQNIAAPEECIYRQNAKFVQAISKLFEEDIFNGRLSVRPSGLQYHKGSNQPSGQHGVLENAGVGGVLRQLCNNGDISFSATESWFHAFSNAMTNRFRFQYGAAVFNSPNPTIPSGHVRGIGEASETLLPGEVLGQTLQTSICVSSRLEWLALPICLTIIAALLTAWTVVTSWRHRHTRPVWKDSILPLIFCSHIIEPTHTTTRLETEAHVVGPFYRRPQPPANTGGDAVRADHHGYGPNHHNGVSYVNGAEDCEDLASGSGLLEASKMKSVGDGILITFRWPANNGKGKGGLEAQSGAEEMAPTTRSLWQRRSWWEKKRRQGSSSDADMDSLLETDD